jgi:hypothetical protein
MRRQSDNSDNYFSSTVFIVLFFLFISAFAGNLNTSVGRDSQSISASELHSQVIALNDAQQISCQKIVIRYLENTDFKSVSDSYKIIDTNRSILHKILYLQKTELLIKPVIFHRSYYKYHIIDTDDLPVLS